MWAAGYPVSWIPTQVIKEFRKHIQLYGYYETWTQTFMVSQSRPMWHLKSIRRTDALLEDLILPQIFKNSPHFIELRGLLPYSQQPSTCSYPEPEESIRAFPILFLSDPFNTTVPWKTIFETVSFLQVSPPKLCIHFYPLRAMCNA